MLSAFLKTLAVFVLVPLGLWVCYLTHPIGIITCLVIAGFIFTMDMFYNPHDSDFF